MTQSHRVYSTVFCVVCLCSNWPSCMALKGKAASAIEYEMNFPDRPSKVTDELNF